MTSMIIQNDRQEAVAGIAALVGDVAQDNARLPGQAASSFGALMGSLGQQAMPDGGATGQNDAAAGDGADDQALPGAPTATLPQLAQRPVGDALMRAIWPAWQAPQGLVTAPEASVADGVPSPAPVSTGPTDGVEASGQPEAAHAAPAPAESGQSELAAMAPAVEANGGAQAGGRTDAGGAGPAPARDAEQAAAHDSPHEDESLAISDADRVMAWQRAAYAQAAATPAPHVPENVEQPAPGAGTEATAAGEGQAQDLLAPASWRASSAIDSVHARAPQPREAASASAAPTVSAQAAARPAAAAAPAHNPASAAASEAAAAGAPLAHAMEPQSREVPRDDADADSLDEPANAAQHVESAASFFPANMMLAPAPQPAPVAAASTPAPTAEAPKFDAAAAFERSAQARSMPRPSQAAADDADEAGAAAAAQDAPEGAAFHQALQTSQAAPSGGAEAAGDVQATQAAQGPAVPREAVSQELSQAITQGANRVQMRIVPEGLGELDIKVQMTGQQVHLTIRGDAPELAQLLSHNVQELRADLQSQGLSLEAMDFGALAANSQGSSFAQEQRSQGYAGPQHSEALGQGSLQRLAGSTQRATAAPARGGRGTGPSHRIIDVVL